MSYTSNNLPDYRGPRKRDGERSGGGAYWWKENKTNMHGAVCAAVRHIDRDQAHKFRAVLRAVRMYGNRRIANLGPTSYARPDPISTRRLRYNIVANTVDTATAFVAKETPRVVAVTDGGSYRLQRKAKLLSKFFYGLFTANGVYDNATSVFRDGALTGGGCYKVAREGQQIKIERVFLDELLWDDADAVKGCPRSLYHRVWMSREKAKENWPSAAKKIDDAPVASPPGGGAEHGMQADIIELIEAWHLKSSAEANDGVHALVVDGHTILKEAYDYPDFPFAWFHYGAKPPKGYIPQGLAERLVGIQIAINQHLDTIESSLRMLGVPRVYVSATSDVSVNQFNNAIGAIVKYDGEEKPFIDNSSPIAQDLIQHLMWTIQSGYEIAGVTRLSATGEKPEGLNSGAALREYKDIESVTFSTIQRSYEQMFVKLAHICTWFARDLYEDGVDLKADSAGQRFLESIPWSEVDLEDNPYTLQVFPTSMLPKEPAARFAQIDEWVQRGWVPKEEAMLLMDMPDLDRANALMSAAVEDIEATIDDILHGEPTSVEKRALEGLTGDEYEEQASQLIYQRNQPDPMQNLTLALQKVRAQWLLTRHQSDVSDSRKQRLVDFIKQAEYLLSQQEMEAGAAAAQGMVPTAVPGNPAVQPGMQPPIM